MPPPFDIGFLIYPGMTQLDFTGPAELLHRIPGARIRVVARDAAPVRSDSGITFLPDETIHSGSGFRMVCVPGGFGCTEVMEDAEILSWLRDQATGVELLTAVCTGSLILAAAGLLEGYRATTHWAWMEALPLFGAIPEPARSVRDRNRITAGGVTAGIDFGFRILEERCGRDFAETIQLGLEYDPEPLSGGTPATARPEILEQSRALMAPRLRPRWERILEIAARPGAA